MTQNYEDTPWFVCHTSDKIFRWCVKMQLVATSASKVIELNFACTQCSNKKIIYIYYIERFSYEQGLCGEVAGSFHVFHGELNINWTDE